MVELIILVILKFLFIKSTDIRIFPLFLTVSITSSEKICKPFWLVNKYQLSQRETSKTARDDPRGGREDMRACFNVMACVPSENIMPMALFHALRKPCCDRKTSKLNIYVESLAPGINFFITQVHYWICILFSNGIFILLVIKPYWFRMKKSILGVFMLVFIQ